MKKLDLLGLICFIVFLVVLAYQASAYTKTALDDAYIFYKYAENIAAGDGYGYNPGERVLGTTSPLYTLVLAMGQVLLGWLPFFTLPRFGVLISALSMFVICLQVAGYFRRAELIHGAMLFPVIMLAMALVWDAVGMDVIPAVALGLLAFTSYQKGRLKTAAMLAALTVLTRPDAALVPAIIFLDGLLVHRRWPGWGPVGIFVGVFIPWLVFSQAYFGTMIPSSIAAKAIQSQSGSWGGGFSFLNRAIHSWPFHVSIKDATLIAVGVSIPLILLSFRRFGKFQESRLVFAWVILHMAIYGLILRPAPYRWYYIPLALGLAMILAMGAEVAVAWLWRRRALAGRIGTVVVLLWAGWVGVDFANRQFRDPFNYKYNFYTEAAVWLNSRASSGSVVGCYEIGALGYYYRQGTTLDLLGLVNREVSELLRDGDFARPVEVFQPDYLLLKDPPIGPLEVAASRPWFDGMYRKEIVLGEGNTRLGIYRYIGPENED